MVYVYCSFLDSSVSEHLGPFHRSLILRSDIVNMATCPFAVLLAHWAQAPHGRSIDVPVDDSSSYSLHSVPRVPFFSNGGLETSRCLQLGEGIRWSPGDSQSAAPQGRPTLRP